MLYVITTLQLPGTNTKTSKETTAIILVGHCDGLDQGVALGVKRSHQTMDLFWRQRTGRAEGFGVA